MNIIEKLNGKRILIWGYGREGKSTERFLASHCPAAQVSVYEGSRDGIDEAAFDFIIKSPGIVMPEDVPKYTSQTELFLEAFRDQTIGITGTKGKSTTSRMLYEAIRGCGKDVLLVGNIGLPCLDEADRIGSDTCIVFELSCHQLAHSHVSPRIAVFLNLFEEHLDYYGSLERYFEAKSHIARYQKEGDVFLRGWNVPDIPTAARVVPLTQAPERDWQLTVNGEQNRYNAEAAFLIASELLGLDAGTVKRRIELCEGLPHRLQLIGTVSGVRFYDDSISTIPEATIAAVRSIPETRTVLIGGMDRGIGYRLLSEFILRTPEVNFICAYESGRRIMKETARYAAEKASAGPEECGGKPANLLSAKDLAEQVALAKRITPAGSACILSPAAASYGYFRNFEERGDAFRELVLRHDG
ncbi:UDP-N-acetylmuramoyl-L-alanine--D-glutamate ligase [Lachnoclostridium sp. Marseille-P6806]|uniref:UDP-N-acetylmuramoyl-L-alanine--D-glutamate ligase n=1 Tax=Lachnoclostridium sp. Marseille-P6806 TaxID=2364793 RepID=UPI00102F9A00|nr:UDP-N-acetylmuramoyl-L-alanine--D-glutamate ligase [Lachnoclostridium sp. Marseille-P6806]